MTRREAQIRNFLYNSVYVATRQCRRQPCKGSTVSCTKKYVATTPSEVSIIVRDDHIVLPLQPTAHTVAGIVRKCHDVFIRPLNQAHLK